MKYLIIIGNGLTDQPIAEKDNQTPLQLADKPNLDRLAKEGRTGSVATIPESHHAGSDVSYLSLLGYDPETYYSGAAHFEAKALGVSVSENEIPLCCDFIILQSSHNDMIVKDYTAGQLNADDSNTLISALQENIIDDDIHFHSGGGYHNLMVMKGEAFPERLQPPNELIGEGIRKHIPQDKPYKDLVHIMNQAQIILHNHPYNKQRAGNSEDAVNSVWLWGNGEAKTLPTFEERFGKKAALISPSLLFKGMAKSAGIDVVDVPTATGFLGTDYQAKVSATMKALDTHDVVYLNIEGGEPVSLMGMIDDKVAAIEEFDEKVVGPVLQEAELRGNVKVLLTENHISSVDLMRYKKDPVPFVIYTSAKGADAVDQFDEGIVQNGSEHFKSGPALIEAFLKEEL